MNTYEDELPPWYVTGFAEREGTFTYSRSERGLSLLFGAQVSPQNADLLRRIREFFGKAGKIYPRRPPGSSSRAPATAYSFRVTRVDELLRVVNHFDLYPFQGSRRASFEVWREMVLLKSGPERADPAQLDLLAAQLSALLPPGRSRSR